MTKVAPILLIPLMLAACTTTSAQKKLDDQIATYKAAGEPVEPADFNVSTVAAKDNAVPELRAAGKVLNENIAVWQDYEELSDIALPLSDREVEVIRGAALAEVAALAHLDAATTRPAVDWGIRLHSPVQKTEFPDLNRMWLLFSIVGDRALLEHEGGNDAVALADVDRVIFLSRAVAKMPSFVPFLASQTHLQSAARIAEMIAPDLRIGTAPGDASPKAVAELIAALLDDQPRREALRYVLLSDRMIQLDSARSVMNGAIDMAMLVAGPGATQPATGTMPVIDRETGLADTLILVRRATAVAEATSSTSNWPALKAKLPPLPPELLNDRPRHIILALFLPSVDPTLRREYQVAADRRMAAVALALRWYAVDHHGQRPATLKELVPAYLPRVALDPMTDDQPLRYDRDKAIVYSIGEDGHDDGGRENANARRWKSPDAVLHLDRQPRPAPSTAP